MSTSQWLSSLASAGGLLTDNECSMLLEVDLFNTEGGKAIWRFYSFHLVIEVFGLSGLIIYWNVTEFIVAMS